MAPSSVPEAEDEFFCSNVASNADVDSTNATIRKALTDLKGIANDIENKQRSGGFSAQAAMEIERDIFGLKRKLQQHLDSQDFQVLQCLKDEKV